jgi:broad specificity phosphatase PhoE
MAKPMSLDDDSRCHHGRSGSFSGSQQIPITATGEQQIVGWAQFTANPQDSSSILLSDGRNHHDAQLGARLLILSTLQEKKAPVGPA